MTQISYAPFSGNFYDFHCIPTDSEAPDGYQYISPNLTFPCDGVVTEWKIGMENKKNKPVYLQIWRPNGTGTGYSRVAESDYTHSSDTSIAVVTTDMTVSAGDVIGFFLPRDGMGPKVAWAPVPDHTLLQGMRSTKGVSPVATFSDSSTALSSSPLVSVIFSKCAMIV